jgi:hypothetical protein
MNDRPEQAGEETHSGCRKPKKHLARNKIPPTRKCYIYLRTRKQIALKNKEQFKEGLHLYCTV